MWQRKHMSNTHFENHNSRTNAHYKPPCISHICFCVCLSMCVFSQGGVCLVPGEPVNTFPLQFNICPSS